MSESFSDQLRKLADDHWLPIEVDMLVAHALRSAADRLEAVRSWAESSRNLAQGDEPDYDALFKITSGTGL